MIVDRLRGLHSFVCKVQMQLKQALLSESYDPRVLDTAIICRLGRSAVFQP